MWKAAAGVCRNLTWLEPGHPASDYSCPKRERRMNPLAALPVKKQQI